MPCVGRGSLPTWSLRGLFKRIRCHVACCEGVVAVIEALDRSQEEENDMEDGETGSTHSTQNASEPRSTRWFRWCQALGRRVPVVEAIRAPEQSRWVLQRGNAPSVTLSPKLGFVGLTIEEDPHKSEYYFLVGPYNRRGGNFRIINGRRFSLEILIFQAGPVAARTT